MTELFEPVGEYDARLALGASGALADFNRAGVLTAADLQVATRTADLGGEDDASVRLALALAVRAVRTGSVCLDLAAVDGLREVLPDLPWPAAAAWAEVVAASPLVAQGALRWEPPLLYLDRYHRLEEQVARDLVSRATAPPPSVDDAALEAALRRVRGVHFSAEQEAAAVHAVRNWTTVLTGGPGTGKTTTVARMLVLLADQARAQGRSFNVALAAPTGKAATRLHEAVTAELAAMSGLDADLDRAMVGRPPALTLHRLLGWRPDNSTRFRHDRHHRLGYDVVIVDECSMVELTMMARVLDAVRPQARLVLVGDPRQLTSVGAGAVLADVVRGFESASGSGSAGAPEAVSGATEGSIATPVAAVTTNFRSTRRIRRLAEALRLGDADGALDALRLARDDEDAAEVEFLETTDPADGVRAEALPAALAVRAAALAGDPEAAVTALDRHRLLCAHREGPFGVRRWNAMVEQWLTEELGESLTFGAGGGWYAGRPLLVTANDYTLEIYNGETGVVVPNAEGRPRAWIAGTDRLRDFAPSRLDAVETMHAMTVHKAQGSQAEVVTVVLPDAESRLLTRELLYTAITRAQRRVRVIGTETAVRAAVEREARRASGMAARLRAGMDRNGDATRPR
ncbi:exodeoxyribonuclease V subunit alpha [Nocardioides sp. R-C-SC26]|uniref:exodeoxyribonuclease V subunit alpha n=1 Tax=Nocardioides sp. R-C-SC26 TaxID=2870414 RepID=UPI001E2B759B|nr:exodeoxyribonuclease V subunit alpha [Nocardioides sp. R-C-SC26]